MTLAPDRAASDRAASDRAAPASASDRAVPDRAAGARDAADRASGVSAVARIRAAADGHGGTSLPLLAGEGPLALRRTRAADGAGVAVVGAMSAPLGGDRLRIEAEAAPGSTLTVGASAATVSLPGRSGRPASYDVRLTVGEGATLRWLPEPVIAARGSDLRMTTRAALAPGARLVLREELVLGRHAEEPGHLATRLTVELDGRPLFDQALAFGPGAPPGWDGPAALGGRRAVGQLLLVGPGLGGLPAAPLPSDPADGLAALTPLAGPAVLITALATDGRHLRRLLDEGWAAVRSAL